MTLPFNDIESIERAIQMYKDGYTFEKIKNEFRVSFRQIRKILIEHDVPMRKGNAFSKIKEVAKVLRNEKKDKYHHLIFEQINKGMDYKQYLKKYNLKK